MSKSAKDKAGGHHLEYYDPHEGWYTQRPETVRFHKRYHRREARREQRRITVEAVKEFNAEHEWFERQSHLDTYDDMYDVGMFDMIQCMEDKIEREYEEQHYYDYDDLYSAYDDGLYPAYDDGDGDDWYNSRREQPEDRIIKPEDCGKSLGELLQEIVNRK